MTCISLRKPGQNAAACVSKLGTLTCRAMAVLYVACFTAGTSLGLVLMNRVELLSDRGSEVVLTLKASRCEASLRPNLAWLSMFISGPLCLECGNVESMKRTCGGLIDTPREGHGSIQWRAPSLGKQQPLPSIPLMSRPVSITSQLADAVSSDLRDLCSSSASSTVEALLSTSSPNNSYRPQPRRTSSEVTLSTHHADTPNTPRADSQATLEMLNDAQDSDDSLDLPTPVRAPHF